MSAAAVRVRLFSVNRFHVDPKYDGKFLKGYNPNGSGGRGDFIVTDDPAQAAKFADAGEVMRIRNTPPACRPRRPDGKPNLPLSAFTLLIEPYDEAPGEKP